VDFFLTHCILMKISGSANNVCISSVFMVHETKSSVPLVLQPTREADSIKLYKES